MPVQKQLKAEQIEAFRIDLFAEHQCSHFVRLARDAADPTRAVVDIGGGCGHFARAVHEATGLPVRVVDTDEKSLDICKAMHGLKVRAVFGDALTPQVIGDEGVICFNLILHHLISSEDRTTTDLQKRALSVWRGHADMIFVNEYIYDSYFGDLSARFIYAVTSSKALSALARAASLVMPSLRANTFGIGVRFRSRKSWLKVFRESGYAVVAEARGPEERVSVPRKMLLIKSCRKDSFLLRDAAPATGLPTA